MVVVRHGNLHAQGAIQLDPLASGYCLDGSTLSISIKIQCPGCRVDAITAVQLDAQNISFSTTGLPDSTVQIQLHPQLPTGQNLPLLVNYTYIDTAQILHQPITALPAQTQIELRALDSTTHIIPDTTSYCGGDTIHIAIQGDTTGTWIVHPLGMQAILLPRIQGVFQTTLPGLYTFTYSGYGACGELAQTTVEVRNPTATQLRYLPETVHCENVNELLFPDVPLGGTFAADPGVSISTDGSIDLSTMTTGTYQIHFTPDTNACILSSDYWLIVHPRPPASLAPHLSVDPICEGQPVWVTAPDYYFHRYFLNSNPIGSGDSVFIDQVTDGDRLTVMYATIMGCETQVDSVLNVYPYPEIETRFESDPSGSSSGEDTLILVANEAFPITFHANPPGTEVHWWTVAKHGSMDPPEGMLTILDEGTLNITPALESQHTICQAWFYYQASANGCPQPQDSMRLLVIPSSEPTIFIPGVITPNGDGLNDTWLLTFPQTDPDLYQDHVLEVYNSLGIRVKTLSVMDADWGGEGLPDAIYGYLLKNGKGEKVGHGGLVIQKGNH